MRYFMLVKKRFLQKIEAVWGWGGEEVPLDPSAPSSKYRSCVSCLQVQYGDWSICTNPPLVKIEQRTYQSCGCIHVQQFQLNNFIMRFWKFSLNAHFCAAFY